MTGQAWRLIYWGARAWKPTGVYAYGHWAHGAMDGLW